MGAPDGSTYATSATGLSAIYNVLDKEGFARRWERTADRLPDNVERLVVWNPDELDQADWQALRNWAGRGGTLIVTAPYSDVLPGKTRQAGEAAVRSAAAHPVTVGLNTVSAGGGTFTEYYETKALVHLTRPDGTPVLISWPEGQGRIYWSADEEWLTNARVGQADNLTLALGLLVPGKEKLVAFDEYHHGYQAADRWYQLLRGNLQLFLVLLALGVAVLFWAYGARFGAPIPEPATPPRAAVEYVVSMSHLYRRARARSVVAQNLYRTLTRDLGRLLGGAGGLDHAEIARRTGERTGVPAPQIQKVLDRTAPGAKPEPTDTELIDLAREAEAIQRRVRNAGYRDQRRP